MPCRRAQPSSTARGTTPLAGVYLLKLQAGVLDVSAKEPVRLAGRSFDLGGQFLIRRPEARRRTRSHSLSASSSVTLPAARSARTSAASLLRAFCEFANWRDHCSSSRSSSSSHSAIRSCSSGERVASFATTASRARVMDMSIPLTSERPNKPLERPGMNASRLNEYVCAGRSAPSRLAHEHEWASDLSSVEAADD